ncbi:hypothetical protein ACQY0O_006055 [Thecaphora frezii]
MVNTTGYYVSATTVLSSDGDQLTLHPYPSSLPASKLRTDRHFWLSLDDGFTGRYGQPTRLRLKLDHRSFPIWVEQRGPDHFALVPATEQASYSNTFVSCDGTLSQTYGVRQQWRVVGALPVSQAGAL